MDDAEVEEEAPEKAEAAENPDPVSSRLIPTSGLPAALRLTGLLLLVLVVVMVVVVVVVVSLVFATVLEKAGLVVATAESSRAWT